ncbi:MAG: zinc-dependent alcohol dehydrogenase [Caldicoprobacterales bacterium]|jgi:threonine dehydrogenase-like Zn-dependent dehydrogenase|nr:alcohol dehydrogenase catalytic domain-containing protein [Clostridiales bacterium]
MKCVYFEKDIPRILITKLAAKLFRPLLYTGLNAVKFNRNLPDPPLPADDWLRVRNISCGLCGTDVSFFKATTGTNSALEPIPLSKRTYLGHENVGIVIEAGPAVTKFKVGDRVTIREYMSGCGNKGIKPPCRYCAEGNYNLCLNYGEPSPYNLPDTGAGWSDTFIAPEQQLAKIYDELTDDQAVMVEPTCVSIHSVLMSPPAPGEKVMVLGCGTIGLGIVQALKIVQPNCEVWAMERIKPKQEFALRLGADHILSGDPYEAASKATGGSRVYTGMGGNKMFFGGFDRIYDCVGGSWSNHTCLRLLAPRGTLVKVGHHMCGVKLDETPIWWQELTLVGVDAHGMEEWQGRKRYTFDLAQEWIRDGIYSIDGFITHRFALDDYKKALRLAMENPPELIKIVLDCN